MNRGFSHFDEEGDERDQIEDYDQSQGVSKKDWFAPANVALSQLERVKPSVYNIGLHDASRLKAGSGRSRLDQPQADRNNNAVTSYHVHTQPPLSTLSFQKASWGNEAGIPELLKRYAQAGTKPTRPSSAKTAALPSATTKTRPHSAKTAALPSATTKTRPQSAKTAALPSATTKTRPQSAQDPFFGVKGQKCDPFDRKGCSGAHFTTVGWAGPPAGLCDATPPSQYDAHCGKLGYNTQDTETPAVPASSPEPQFDSGTWDQQSPDRPTQTPSNFCLSLSLPSAETDSEEPDTARLLAEADKYVKVQKDKSLKVKFFQADVPGAEGIGEALKASMSAVPLDRPTDADGDQTSYRDGAWPHNEDDALPDKQDCAAEYNIDSDTNKTGNNLNTSDIGALDTNQNVCESDLHLHLDSGPGSTSIKPLPDMNGFDLHYLGPTQQERKTRSHPIFLMPDDKPSFQAAVVAGRPPPTLRSGNNRASSAVSRGNNRASSAVSRGNNRASSAVSRGKSSTEENGGHPRSTLVHIREDRNITVDITPRNLGRKVASMGKSHKTQHDVTSLEVKNAWASAAEKAPYDRASDATACPANSSFPPRPITPAAISVVYDDDDDDDTGGGTTSLKKKLKQKHQKRLKETDPVTMVLGMHLSDEEEDDPSQEVDLMDDEECDDEQEPTSSSPLLSTGDKNYYDIGRKLKKNTAESTMSQEEKENFITMTTKTILFDTNMHSPQESSVKTILDAPMPRSKSRLNTDPDITASSRPKRSRRRGSAQPTKSPPNNPCFTDPSLSSDTSSAGIDNDRGDGGFTSNLKNLKTPTQDTEEERPMSRRGFVTTETKQDSSLERDWEDGGDNSGGRVTAVTVSLCRPPSGRHHPRLSAAELTEGRRSPVGGRKSRQSSKRDVIPKRRPHSATALLNRSQSVADIERARAAAQALRVEKAAIAKPAVVNGAARYSDPARRYASYNNCGSKNKRPQTTKTSVNPVFLVSKQPSLTVVDTQDMLDCKEMQDRLACYGIDVKPETLHRALYPPTGDTLHFQINANLPRSFSAGLLSHPKYWLPTEHKNLRLAEKKLAMAELALWKQKQEEERKAAGTKGKKVKKKLG